MADEPTPEQVRQIAEAVAAGHKLQAIKLYREATGKGLKEAKEFIDALAAELAEREPEKYASLSQKKGCGAAVLCVAVVLAAVLGRLAFGGEAGPRLPEGPTGLATKFPGDKGIETHPDVLFVERFDEGSLPAVFKRWESVKSKGIMSLSSDAAPGSADRSSLLMTHIGGQGTGGHLYRRLPPGHDVVFARFYVKFAPDCAPIHHFGTHLGGYHPPTPWPQGGAGLRPRGDRRFTTGVEPYGKSWAWGFYTYWQGMHVHGDGRYWGTPFLTGGAKPRVDKGKWICVEMMVKVNKPVTASNGEQACWIDGKLFRRGGQIVGHIGPGFPRGRWTGGWWRPEPSASTTFDGFRWRSVEALKVNYLWTYLYITRAPKGHASKVWFDNIVLARSYIGPMQPLRRGR